MLGGAIDYTLMSTCDNIAMNTSTATPAPKPTNRFVKEFEDNKTYGATVWFKGGSTFMVTHFKNGQPSTCSRLSSDDNVHDQNIQKTVSVSIHKLLSDADPFTTQLSDSADTQLTSLIDTPHGRSITQASDRCRSGWDTRNTRRKGRK